MEKLVFKAERREIIGKHVKSLRHEGKLPAILYGKHLKAPIPVVLDLRESTRPLNALPKSALVVVDLGNEKHTALVREKQRNFLTGGLLHIDFQVVSMTETLHVKVALHFEGDAPAVKNYNGVLVTSLEQLNVEALPADLPEKIVVDVTGLEKIGDSIHVRDLKLSDKVHVMDDLDTMVAIVSHQAAEEVEVAAVAEPEVIEKGKKEEEA